jgi:cell division protein FtsB
MNDLYYRKTPASAGLIGRIGGWLHNRNVLAALIVGIPLAGYLLFGSRGIVQRVRLEHEKTELQQKIREAEAEGKRLQEESKALEGDVKTIEKVARERYDMVRPGEKVYRISRNR